MSYQWSDGAYGSSGNYSLFSQRQIYQKGYRAFLSLPGANGVFNEGFTKKGDFGLKYGIYGVRRPEKQDKSLLRPRRGIAPEQLF